MIIDTLENFDKYISLHPLFKKVAVFLSSHNLSELEYGNIELEGKELFAKVAQTKPKSKEDGRLESHKLFIDIQIPLSDKEIMGHTMTKDCQPVLVPYDDSKDVMFFDGLAENYVTIHPGMFVIFFPQDAHVPEISMNGIKKMVIKVRK